MMGLQWLVRCFDLLKATHLALIQPISVHPLPNTNLLLTGSIR